MPICKKCGGTPRSDGGCNVCELFAAGQTPGGTLPSCWPMKSMALGCHPEQIPELVERNRKHGCSVTYQRDGQAIIPDRKERKKLLKLEGKHDNNAGYGD